ncbi:MAG: rubrerythrin family protein [Clostridiales bacterium]|nr:rubrerythrin family protein [Clostridiales bacterium]
MNFQESKTKENLARSFAAECQEGARYQFLAKMAQKEGYQYMSMLIRTLAHNEMAHAQQFFNMIVKYGENETQNIEITAGYPFKSGELVQVLQNEADNEHMSAESIYPKFADIARDEGYKDVAELFDMISKVERTHERTLRHLHDSLTSNCLYKCNDGDHAFKCDECGTIVKDKCAPKICPLCHMGQGYFRIDFSIN